MDWMELMVHTTTEGAEIVSATLMSLGANGTMIQDRADIPDPTKPNGYWELIDPDMVEKMPEDVIVTGWFEANEVFQDVLSSLKASLEDSQDMRMGSLEVGIKHVHDEDWSEVWKQYYKPFHICNSIVVKPSWEDYEKKSGEHILHIDPGMAFGTGTHESTAMCMTLLEKYMQSGMTVFDVGTGSGILAIGAALLGAGSVLAVDIDPQAVRVAEENVTLNGLSDVITVAQSDLLKTTKSVCELCVANIIADVICGLAQPLRANIAKEGCFICSGIIKEREQDVVQALLAAEYTVLETLRQGEWVAMIARR